jgi:Tfp pilus assembly protein PilO
MLIFLGIIIVCIAYYYAAYQPMNKKINVLKRELQSKEQTRDVYMETIRKIPALEERYAQLEYIEKEEYITSLDSVDQLLQILEDEAVFSGIKITSFVPRELEDNIVYVDMMFEGSYDELLVFLNGIKKLHGMVEFGNLIITRLSEGNGILEVEASISYDEDLSIGGDQT